MNWRARTDVRRYQGYTLIELLMVLAILAVLSLLAMPLAEMTVQRERERELRRALWEIRDAIDGYRKHLELKAEAKPRDAATLYPPNLQALLGRDGSPRFLRRIPRDPFADPLLPAEATWGLRSYASDAARPMPGNEVYDVFSLSERIGGNGIPLRQW